MEAFNTLSAFLVVLSLSLTVNCSEKWCPCLQPSNSLIQNSSKHEVTPYMCEKYKGVLFSEEREFKCECCLIIRAFQESCRPAKNPKFVVKCEEGLNCDRKYVCREVKQSIQSVVLAMKSPELKYDLDHPIDKSFAEMLMKMFSCDCSKSKCDNEVTRQECEDHQGLFIDKLSVRNRCQCCDRCYIPRGQHQSCGGYHKKNVQLVCDTGLYCSPFTHMCIEKREIFSQFLKKINKESGVKRQLGVFEEENQPAQSIFVRLNRKKRDDEEAAASAGGEAPSPAPEAGGEHTTAAEGGEPTTVAAGGEGGEGVTVGGEGAPSSTEEETTTTEAETTTTEEPTTTTTTTTTTPRPKPTTTKGKGKGHGKRPGKPQESSLIEDLKNIPEEMKKGFNKIKTEIECKVEEAKDKLKDDLDKIKVEFDKLKGGKSSTTPKHAHVASTKKAPTHAPKKG